MRSKDRYPRERNTKHFALFSLYICARLKVRLAAASLSLSHTRSITQNLVRAFDYVQFDVGLLSLCVSRVFTNRVKRRVGEIHTAAGPSNFSQVLQLPKVSKRELRFIYGHFKFFSPSNKKGKYKTILSLFLNQFLIFYSDFFF